jgi:hypothetical protein
VSKIEKDAIELEVSENIKKGIQSVNIKTIIDRNNEFSKNSKKGKQTTGNRINDSYGNINNLIKNIDTKTDKTIDPLERLSKLYSVPSEVVSKNNMMVFTNAIFSCSTIVLIIITIVVVSCAAGKMVPIKKILIENFITFAFIGIVEFLFFKFVASKYVPVEPSYIMNVAINELSQ